MPKFLLKLLKIRSKKLYIVPLNVCNHRLEMNFPGERLSPALQFLFAKYSNDLLIYLFSASEPPKLFHFPLHAFLILGDCILVFQYSAGKSLSSNCY